MIKGVGGQTLHIDLTSGAIEKKPLDENMIRKYLLGAGFLSKMLFDGIPEGTEPLSAENVLGFATGLLTGSMFPQSSRHVIAALSPLTGIWGESHAAGFWGPELKFAGYDAMIFTGASDRPVYLHIEDSKVELLDATGIWDKDVFETDGILRTKHGRQIKGPFHRSSRRESCSLCRYNERQRPGLCSFRSRCSDGFQETQGHLCTGHRKARCC